jgi:hypothetical protein
MILGATVQKLWVFEVFGQGLARAGMCWSQGGGVDQSAQKWEKKEEKKGEARAKKGDPQRDGRRPLVGGGCPRGDHGVV